MAIRRFPRLPAARARIFLEALCDADATQIEEKSRLIPDLATESFAATGAPKVSGSELLALREVLKRSMIDAGFPGDDLIHRQKVDRALAVELASMDLPVGELLRPDTWTWLCIHLLPEYLKWRWSKADGKITEDRVTGQVVRNALGRLWLRGWILDRGDKSEDRWGLVKAIPEDATVAVLERTSVSADHRLARSIVEAWLVVTKGKPKTEAETTLRNGMIRTRIQSSLVETRALSDIQLKEFVTAVLR